MADRTARRLQKLIADSGLQPGELLPPERQLCELLAVSRTVVREAVRSLAAKGLLEVRQGHGTIVRFPGGKGEIAYPVAELTRAPAR